MARPRRGVAAVGAGRPAGRGHRLPAGLAARRARGRARAASTAASRSTASTCGSATTRTPSASLREAYAELDRPTFRPRLPDPDLARRVHPRERRRPRLRPAGRLARLAGLVPRGRPPARRRARRRRRPGRRRLRAPGRRAGRPVRRLPRGVGRALAAGGAEHSAQPAVATRRARPTWPGRWAQGCGPWPRAVGPVTGRRASSSCSWPWSGGSSPTASSTRGFGAIDHLDLRDWLRSHGASEAAVDSPFVRGAYDLAFAYEGGDRSRPRVRRRHRAAAHGSHVLRLPRGDVLEDAGRDGRRGVRAALRGAAPSRGAVPLLPPARRAAPGGRRRGRSRPSRSAARWRCAPGVDEYDPLVRVGGLPVFPDDVDLAQLDAVPAVAGQPLEAHCVHLARRRTAAPRGRPRLRPPRARRVGRHGPARRAALLAARPRWRAMVDHLGTVATQAVQLWLRPDERTLGWPHPPATVTGCGAPLDTFASMSQTLPFEDWPDDDGPGTAASFCAVLEDEVADGANPTAAVDRRRGGVPRRAGPQPVAGGGRRPRLPLGPPRGSAPGTSGSEALASQYVRANVDPSDRYVQALPGQRRPPPARRRQRLRQPCARRRLDRHRASTPAASRPRPSAGSRPRTRSSAGRSTDRTTGFRPTAEAHG